MIKIIGNNSIYLVGRIKEIKRELNTIQNKNITVAEYIKLQLLLGKKSLN